MNKLAKGAVAAGLGTILLLGGAGTFAYWNSSVGVSGAAITAGNLVVTDAAPTSGVWTVQKNGAGAALPIADIATFRAVPGDKLSFVKTVKITATGDNLEATLSLAAGSITAASSGNATANSALATFLTKTATVSATGAGIVADGANFTVTPGTAGITDRDVTVTVVVNFPKDAVAGTENLAKTGAVTLAGLTVDLVQK